MNCPNGDRLSWGDALFLYLERAGMPLNIASVSIFEGQIALQDCVRFIESKLPLLPRYYQRVVVPPLNIGLPAWDYDPSFDIHNHFTEVSLKRGTEKELKTLAGRIFSHVMDRQRPLWDFTLVSGLHGDRSALITRIHHCLADGIAGVGLMNVLMDSSPEPHPLPKRKRPRPSRRQNDPLTQMLDGWVSNYSNIIGRALSAYSDLSTLVATVASGERLPTERLSKLLPELTAPAERLFFNVTYQGPQKFAFTKIPVSEVKAVRQRCGATFNDIVLAVMTSTIARYSALHGEKLKGRLLRMMVPVNVRGEGGPGELGNRILLLPVTVPLGIDNPKRLLAEVHQRMEFLKSAHAAELFGLAGGMVGAVPAALQALVGPIASLLPITPFNLVCTNIRGPETPLYLLGHKMLDWYPYVPVGGEMALNCAILSYNGFAYFGFSGDVHAAPDIARLEALLKQSFNDLKESIDRSSPQKRKSRSKANPRSARAQRAQSSGLQPTNSEPRSPNVLITQLAPAEQMTGPNPVTPTAVAAD
jgi:diacylglycerol O-acyltransferase / wax synthase